MSGARCHGDGLASALEARPAVGAGCRGRPAGRARSCPREVSQALGQAPCCENPEQQIAIFPGCYSHLQKENVQTSSFANKS